MPYPESYYYKPYSKNYVRNIKEGYAQSHPTEDFAETFAVWLNPKSNWKKKYASWPVMKKLKYMDKLMSEIAGKKSPLGNRKVVCPISKLDYSLGKHYSHKKKYFRVSGIRFWDSSLRKSFSRSRLRKKSKPLSLVLDKLEKNLCRDLSEATGYHQYAIKGMISSLSERSEELSLRTAKSRIRVYRDVYGIINNKASDYMSKGFNLTIL